MKNEFTLYAANCTGNVNNASYPEAVRITDLDSLRRAVSRDHVSAKYRDNHRKNNNFEYADGIMFDVDNTPSEGGPDIPPEQWKTPADVRAAFPNVAFYAVTSLTVLPLIAL